MSQSDIFADIIVVGAGAIGAASALKIARIRPDLSVAVIERQAANSASKESNIRVWALGSAATGLLAELNVFAEIGSRYCHPYQKMVVWDENSEGELSFNASDYEAEALGHMVDADQCALLLQTALEKQPNINCYFETNLVDIEFSLDGPRLVSETHCFSTRLIVAADGANSWVRKQAKIFAPSNNYMQRGLVAKTKTELPHQDTAWQRFLTTGPIAVLPLEKNQSSIVWSCNNELADELLGLSKQEFSKRIKASLANRLGEVSLLSDVFSFPLTSRQAEKYIKAGLVLIGDAAHSIHPLAGQGANLGFKDAIELANLLKKHEDVANPNMLSEYQRKRRADNLQTDLLMTALHNAYRLNLPIWSLVRGTAMNWISNTQAVKNQLAFHAMGLQ